MRMHMHMHMHKRQTGFTLIEMMIVLIIMMGVTTMLAKRSTSGIDENRAKELGVHIAEYVNAVGAYVYAGGLALPNQSHTGVNFLRRAVDCPGGTGGQTHLSCVFPATLGFRVTPSVNIVNTGTQVNTTITFSPVLVGNQPNIPLAGVAVQKAIAGFANYPGSVQVADLDRSTGQIVITTNSVPAASPWLPRDGSQPMTGSLDMDNHAVVDASDFQMRDGRSLSKAYDKIGTDRVVLSGSAVGKPPCQSGMTPAIWVTPMFASADQSTPMGAIQAFATDDGTYWTVYVRVIANNTPIQSASGFRRALVKTNCF